MARDHQRQGILTAGGANCARPGLQPFRQVLIGARRAIGDGLHLLPDPLLKIRAARCQRNAKGPVRTGEIGGQLARRSLRDMVALRIRYGAGRPGQPDQRAAVAVKRQGTQWGCDIVNRHDSNANRVAVG